VETKIVAIGNSRGVRLPRAAIEKSGLAPGEPLDVKASAGKIVLAPKSGPNRRAGWEARFRRAGAARVRENLWGDVPVDEALDR
jgi:antitoxin component of MazEF toxin-antitoxin module